MSTTAKPRKTRQRTAIKATLAAERDFKTAQQVHELLRLAGEPMGLATVYRTLQSLVDQGEADVVRNSQGEMTFRQCSPVHHHHLICRECGKTVEIAAHEIEAWAVEIGGRYGFVDIDHSVELVGLCSDCADSNAAPPVDDDTPPADDDTTPPADDTAPPADSVPPADDAE